MSSASQRSSLLVSLLLLATTVCCSAYPAFWVSRHAKSCTDHPVPGQPYGKHTGVQAATAGEIAFSPSLVEKNTPATAFCPGKQYSIQVTWSGANGYYLTASQGTFALGNPANCPNRQLEGTRGANVGGATATLSVPCSATGSIELKVTITPGSGNPHKQASTTINVDPSCAVPVNQCNSATPAPPASGVVAAPVTLSSGQTAFVDSVNTAPGCNMFTSNYGYECNREIDPLLRLSYTISPSPVPPNNPCTSSSIASAPSLVLPAGANAWMHAMVSSPNTGWVALSFAEFAGRMAPAKAIFGFASDTNFAVSTFDITEYALPNEDSPSQTWAAISGVTQLQTAEGQRTLICFTRAVRFSAGSAPAGRKLLQEAGDDKGGLRPDGVSDDHSDHDHSDDNHSHDDDSKNEVSNAGGNNGVTNGGDVSTIVSGGNVNQVLLADGTASASIDSLLHFNWALGTGDNYDFHSNTGGFRLNMVSGQVENARDNLKKKIRTHGALMLTSFIGLMPMAVLFARYRTFVPNKMMFSKAIWFWLHMAIQVVAVACFLAGFIIAKQNFKEGNIPGALDTLEAHDTIGWVILAAVIAQLLIGMIRPAPDAKIRWIWNILHHNWGRLLIALAIANVSIGIYLYNEMYRERDNSKKVQPYVAFLVPSALILAGYLLLAVILEIMSCIKAKRESQKTQSQMGINMGAQDSGDNSTAAKLPVPAIPNNGNPYSGYSNGVHK